MPSNSLILLLGEAKNCLLSDIFCENAFWSVFFIQHPEEFSAYFLCFNFWRNPFLSVARRNNHLFRNDLQFYLEPQLFHGIVNIMLGNRMLRNNPPAHGKDFPSAVEILISPRKMRRIMSRNELFYYYCIILHYSESK